MVDVKVILPADVGGFTVREAALFDADGDMIVICNMPDTEKAVITTGAAGTLTLVMHIVFTDVDAVRFTVSPNIDVVTAEDVERQVNAAVEDIKRQIAAAIAAHDADPRAHEIKRHVISTRIRDPTKPDYGLGGGDWPVALYTGAYTGETELGVVVSGTEYDAQNLSAKKDTAENGTLIIKVLEE